VTDTSSRGLNVVSSTRSGSGLYRRVREMSCSNGIMTKQPRVDTSASIKHIIRSTAAILGPRMRADMCRYVPRCLVSASVKPEQRPPAGTMESRSEISRPWQLISADLLGPLPRSTNGHEYVLVITDYFSKFPLFTQQGHRRDRAKSVLNVRSPGIMDNGVQFGRSREFQNFFK
jgi:hypothetical protein